METTSHSAFTRAEWARLRSSVPMPLVESDLEALRATGEPLSLAEVEEVFLPLTRLINLHVNATRTMARVADDFVGRPAARRPYVVAVAGSVAVGKSTVARLLRTLLSLWPDHPRVDLVATDGFIYPTKELQARGLMQRKGYPESYDVRRMIRFLSDIRTAGEASLPVYSHQAYDALPDVLQTVSHPDILIFEGLNVLQLGSAAEGKPTPTHTATDFFDLTIYVDAEPTDIEQWYIRRFMLLKATAFQNPASYFHHLAAISDDEAQAFAIKLWQTINLPNLQENILPTRPRADVVVHKRADHAADQVLLRRF